MKDYEIVIIGELLIILMILIHSIWINKKLDKIWRKKN